MKESEQPDLSQPFAVLIDADNLAEAPIDEILDEVRKYGEPVIRRVYGNWTTGQLGAWKSALHVHALMPVQQFSNLENGGKNATDSALIIDAMDILHEKRVHGFCLVTTDSDFTRLATRLREDGKFVLGIGRGNAAVALQKACSRYSSLDKLRAPTPPPAPKATAKSRKAPETAKAPEIDLAGARTLISRALELAQGPDGRAHIAAVGEKLYSIDPAFDVKQWRARNLLALIETCGSFELEKDLSKGPGHVYVRKATPHS